MMNGELMGFGLGIFGWLWMLLFWGGLITLAVWLVGRLFPTAKSSGGELPAQPSAQAILKARYAKGELTREKYQEMLQTIQQGEIS